MDVFQRAIAPHQLHRESNCQGIGVEPAHNIGLNQFVQERHRHMADVLIPEAYLRSESHLLVREVKIPPQPNVQREVGDIEAGCWERANLAIGRPMTSPPELWQPLRRGPFLRNYVCQNVRSNRAVCRGSGPGSGYLMAGTTTSFKLSRRCITRMSCHPKASLDATTASG